MTPTEQMAAPQGPGPRFAPEAESLLIAGQVEEALALARAGADRYPWYPTGLVTLGRCYEAAGRVHEAQEAFREAARLLPDAPVIREALARLVQAELRQATEAPPPADVPPAEPPPEHEGLAPAASPPAASGEPMPPPSPSAPPPPTAPSEETTARADFSGEMERLARTLRGAGPIVPPKGPTPEPEATPAEEAENVRLASATLAEIYVQQQQYGEAIRTYRALIGKHPEEREKFEKRIEEIEDMVRRHLFGDE